MLGANDGVISTASVVLGVASSHASHSAVALTAVASLVAGAMAMAAGEYVSVSSQSDIEHADLAIERTALDADEESEHIELAAIYVERGLTHELADEVARQLMRHDALGAHARDELGITEGTSAKPLQAALASGLSFTSGALAPLIATISSPKGHLIPILTGASLAVLAMLGAVAARAGGASLIKGALRVLFWGGLAMGATALAGMLFGGA